MKNKSKKRPGKDHIKKNTCHCIEKCCCITGFSPAQYSSCLLFVKRERTELEAALVRFGDKIEWLCSHILDGLTGNALKLFSIRAVIYRHRYQSCTLISKAPELRFSIPTQGTEISMTYNCKCSR